MDELPENTHVIVVCQRCSQPIKLHPSLQTKTLKEAVSKVDDDVMGKKLIKALPKSRPTTMIKDPSGVDRKELLSLTEEIEIATESFKTLSSGEVDHPLCASCPEAAMEQYKEEIRMAEEACTRYKRLIFELNEKEKEDENNIAKVDNDLMELREEERKLMAELEGLQTELTSVELDLEKQKDREKHLDEEEKIYWQAFNEHQRQVLELRDESNGAELQLQYTHDQLSRLKRTSVLNTAFHIWHNGHFATINGLRFGKLQNVPVEWSEINAAWGQTTLLLTTLANLCGCSFLKYKLIPYGSQSFVQDSEGKKKQLPLYTGARLFADARYDSAMVAFLDCLGQFKRHIEVVSNGRFLLPYLVDKDRIGDGQEFYSIKMQFNTEERWTKALKFVLTDLRWGMTWVSANLLNDEGGVKDTL